MPRASAIVDAESGRLDRERRRDLLLDAAASMVADGDVEAITMDAVAERAGVSRPLVYKHFANRHELLGAVYSRESALLHAELEAAVTAATSFEGMVRALIRGALDAQARRGATFASLGAAGSRTADRRREQRNRDRTTLAFFAGRAERELAVDRRTARAGLAILLGAIPAVLAAWRRNPTAAHADLLEETYVSLVLGGLERLTADDASARSSTSGTGSQ